MSYANEILKDSPVAWWRLNERAGTTIADEIGSNDGTTSGSVDLLASLLPNLGTGAGFGGTQSIVLGTPSVLDFATNNLFSVEAWVQPSGSAARTGIVGVTTSTPQWGLMIDIVGGSGKFVRWFMLPDSGVNAVFSGGNVFNDTTFHVVVTHTATTTTMYIDGAQSNQDSQGTATRPLESVSIGRYASDHMIGTVDEVAIYHTVLSPTRVLAHYQAGVAMHLSASSALYDE